MFKILGTTDSVNVCDCCGKNGLKKTVALESDETGVVHYGVDCAANAIHGKKSAKNRSIVETTAKGVDLAAKLIAKHGREYSTLCEIVSRIRLFCPATVVGNKVWINGNLV